MRESRFRKPALVACLVALAAGSALAGINAFHVRPGNFTFTAGAKLVPLNAAGQTLIQWYQNSAGRRIVTYSAECSVDAPAGNNFAWVDIDIIHNTVVQPPTLGTADTFCSADGVAGFGGYVRASITIVINGVAGTNSLSIVGRTNAGATGGWLGDSSLVVHD